MSFKFENEYTDFYQKYKGHINLAIEIYNFLQDHYDYHFSEEIVERIASISKKRYTIAVLGKVKSGKSTFINALLQKELLPTGTLETTAAIIEVHYSETPSLYVEYMDGNTAIFNNEDIIIKLNEIAAKGNDDIPTSQLNRFLKKHFDSSKKEVVYTDYDICKLIENELPIKYLQKGNIIEKSIKQYIESNKNGGNIPVKIELHYPHRFKLKETIIVDTPGLETISGLDAETKEYMSKADAILYLHMDDPVEKTLFEFVTSKITKRAMNSTFILLPTETSRKIQDRNKILTETKGNLPEIFHDKIFTIDSLQELCRQKIVRHKMICYEKKIDCDIFDFVFNKLDTHFGSACHHAKRESKDSPEEFQSLLKQYSNFYNFENSLNTFLGNALNEQLRGFLNEIITELKKQEYSLSDQVKAKMALTIEPQWFSQKQAVMNSKRTELEALNEDFSKNINNLLAQNKKVLQEEMYQITEAINGYEKNHDVLMSNFDSFLKKEKVSIALHIKKGLTGKQYNVIKKFAVEIFNPSVLKLNSKDNIISSSIESTSANLKHFMKSYHEKITQKMSEFKIDLSAIQNPVEHPIKYSVFPGKLNFDTLFGKKTPDPKTLKLNFYEKISNRYSKSRSKKFLIEYILKYLDKQSNQLINDIEKYRNLLEQNIYKSLKDYETIAQSYEKIYSEFFESQQTELDNKKSEDKKIRDEIDGLNHNIEDITAKMNECKNAIGEL